MKLLRTVLELQRGKTKTSRSRGESASRVASLPPGSRRPCPRSELRRRSLHRCMPLHRQALDHVPVFRARYAEHVAKARNNNSCCSSASATASRCRQDPESQVLARTAAIRPTQGKPTPACCENAKAGKGGVRSSHPTYLRALLGSASA